MIVARRLASLALALPIAAGAAFLAANPAGAVTSAIPVGPNQPFIGSTHGPLGTNKILVICPAAAAVGHPAANQTVEVTPIAATIGGFTGSKANRIVVTFPAPAAAPQITLRHYGEAKPIPTSLLLPCGATELVRFTPEPTSKTARADLVPVAFEPGPSLSSSASADAG